MVRAPGDSKSLVYRALAGRAPKREIHVLRHLQRYQSRGVLLFARYDGEQYTLVGMNTADDEATIPFWFPLPGDYLEELHGDDNLKNVLELQQIALTLPSHYGRIWTRITDR